MPQVTIHCLGAFSVTQAGVEVTGFESDKARALLSRAIQLDPKIVSARMSLARLLVRLKDVPAAEARLKEVLAIEPQNQAARLTLSELAWSRGDKELARKWLEEAVSVQPSAVAARLRLAQNAFNEGDATKSSVPPFLSFCLPGKCPIEKSQPEFRTIEVRRVVVH